MSDDLEPYRATNDLQRRPADARFRVEPVFGAISCVAGGLLGYVTYAVGAGLGHGAGGPLAVVSGHFFAVAFVGLLAARPDSGRVRALLAVTSGLFLVVAAGLSLVLALVGAGTATVVVGFGLLACVFLAVAYGLVCSGQ